MTISIVIPTSSRPERCFSLVDSLKNASDIEIIVVENGSSLANKKRYSRLFKAFPEFVKLVFSFEVGAPKARNLGASISSFDWVWFIDDDDMVESSTINDCVQVCKRVKNIEVIITPFSLLSDPKKIYSYSYDTANFKYIRKFGHIGNANIIIIRKIFFNQLGRWDCSLPCGQDTDFFLRVFKESPLLYFLNTTPVEIRDDFRGRITLDPNIQMRGKIIFLYKHLGNLHLLRISRYLISFIIAWPYLKFIYWKIKGDNR
jgi:glycosyltransferase involved in cell wall biosynthesis